MKIKISSSPFSGIFSWGNISKTYISEFYRSIIFLKCFLILFVFFQFVIFETAAQNFFPLKVGNTYQVEDDWWWYYGSSGNSGTNYYYFSVIKDTTINNETFFKLSSNWGDQPFKRQYFFKYDSLQQKLMIWIPSQSTARIAVDFNAPADSHYISYISGTGKEYISQGIFYKVVLGDSQLVYSTKHPMGGGDYEYTYEFASNVGPSRYKTYIMSTGYESYHNHDIIGAIVDSMFYNPLVLSVDSLYPTFDRPVDTFPFLLTIPYTASYSALIDSFYLDVQHLRADTLVQIKKYNISTSNPHISFNLTGLLSGDKIKFRVTITDTSIFYNFNHYPHTGWVVMNVLPPILNVESGNLPSDYKLVQNFPNPFNPITTIRYQIPEHARVTIKVYDVLGNEIETLIKDEKIAGSYEIEFDGSGLTSGIYYYRITTGDFSQTKKMILLK